MSFIDTIYNTFNYSILAMCIKWFFIFLLALIFFLSFFYSQMALVNSVQKKIAYFIVSFGLVPYLISWVLNIFLLVTPNKPSYFYVLVLVLLGIFLLSIMFIKLKKIIMNYLLDDKNKLKIFLFSNKFLLLGFLILFLHVFVGWIFYISKKSLSEHDTLEYATLGKIFYQIKTIHYQKVPYFDNNGFYYVGLHGFSFPLLQTFELISNEVFMDSKNLFFRSINSIYGGLILMLGFLFLWEKVSFVYAFVYLILITSVYSFFETIMKYHIDNFRVFFILSCCYYILDLFRKNLILNFKHIGLLGLFLGAMANTHSLGFMLTFFILIGIFLTIQEKFFIKLKVITLITLMMMLFGGYHYIIDIFWGTGWIFQEIKFY